MKVRITKAGDSPFKVGQVIALEQFVTVVRMVLENGGEMPVAVLV